MERDTFVREVRRIVRSLGGHRLRAKERISDATIVEVYYLAVIDNQGQDWGCSRKNWPPRTAPRRLPSPSWLSRRLRSEPVRELLAAVERVLRERACGEGPTLVRAIDGKPLIIGNGSHDPHAGYGRAAGGKAKGYKLHAVVDTRGNILDWRLAPMNKDERTMARRLLKAMAGSGYLLADGNYDSNKLFELADEGGVQMVVPRRYGPDKGLGKQKHSPARLRSRDLLENTVSDFGRELHHERDAVERVFGTLTCTAGLLNGLPPWVRTYPRTFRWVQAKIALYHLRRTRKALAMAA